MSDYNHYLNMSKNEKDRMCDHQNIQQLYEQIKHTSTTNYSNDNSKKSLKRTESKMDENQLDSEDNSEIESQNTDDLEWKHQRKSNKRGNKAPRLGSFVQGRTITSSSRGYSRTENKITRHTHPQEEEEQNERRTVKYQLSNLEKHQKDTESDIQYLHTNFAHKQTNNETQNLNDGHSTNENKEFYVTRQALKFAVEDKFPPLRILCDPQLKTHEDGTSIIKEFLKYIEQKFKKTNPRFKQPLGFDHYTIDGTRSLVCYTKYIELFIYMRNINNYPKEINNIKLTPVLPTKLPPRNAIILKFIDNTIKLEDIQLQVKEKLKSVYAIEEMMGTMTYRSRHIRIDLLSQDECTSALNSGKFALRGHLYDVDEYLPSPRILICNKCNSPGHVKKNCKSTIEICKRCGNDRHDDADHKNCIIKCHHCGENHEAISFKCNTISKFRQNLLNKLKENKHLLPAHIQFYIPQQYREYKGEKALTSSKAGIHQSQVHYKEFYHNNQHDYNVWPKLSSNLSLPPPTTNSMPIWNVELKQIQEELYNLKHQNELEINRWKMEHESQMQKIAQGWQLINLQFKTQAEAIVDIYTTLSEILPPAIKSIQTINHAVKEFNKFETDENERQRKELTYATINETISSLNNRLYLLTNHQQKLKTLMDKQNDLLLRGMNTNEQANNEL
ncbi:unnamed protein product [Rotaria socialis]|uniref:CCHC-type domain-containing protein n=2 Tax=Rotaria socialis TaxID=392032 RepID=A0A817YKT1_9BILA|nr:unnamed protein product [Rotaria socialis]CAF4356655.1 unnamed protein product [Rotaria socialis]CAF4652706.1 unnamed protein product [Rotaria socialis]